MKHERLWLLAGIAVVIPTGLAVKYCVPDAVGDWCRLYGAAILYEICCAMALRLLLHRLSPALCGTVVFLGTCALELLQLWHQPALDALRHTFLGAAMLGQSFDPWDFLYYAIGSALAVPILMALRGPEVEA
jgi:hypothetical protein